MFEEREILPSFEYLFIKFYCIFNFHIYIDKIRNRNKNDSMFNKIRGIALFVISFSLKTKKRILILYLGRKNWYIFWETNYDFYVFIREEKDYANARISFPKHKFHLASHACQRWLAAAFAREHVHRWHLLVASAGASAGTMQRARVSVLNGGRCNVL